MLREWTDKLPDDQAAEVWREEQLRSALRKLSTIEAELKTAIASDSIVPTGFYDAMRHFIAVRAKMFPNLPADPAWNILVTLASTPDGDARNSVTSIAYGADVPLATAVRYIGIMEVEGIVERVADPNDRRRSIIRLTTEGRHRLDAIASRWKSRALVLMTLLPLAAAWILRTTGLV